MNSDKRSKLIKTVLIGFALGILVHWILQHSTKPQGPQPPPVVVQQPKFAKITDYVTQTGTVVAYNSVNLVARIEGYLDAIEFTDGTFIKKGKELFIIEPKPYLEKLNAAQAEVAIQRASYAYTSAEYKRQQNMYKQNATSLNNVEKWYAQSLASKSEIDKAVANAEIAAINYSYTHVLAPFDGRIGRHLVDLGNLVGNGAATNLATLEQIDPIYVYFHLNELDLFQIREAARTHAFKPEQINQIPVFVKMQNETDFLHEGRLDFVNTGLNASTGTLEFRARLPNKDLTLLPGFFVQVRIPISSPAPQLTIPDNAVQYDQIGTYALIVDSNNIVHLQRIVTGAHEQNYYAIIKGLTVDDRVIVDGLQNATPGNPVTPQAANEPPTQSGKK